VDLIVPLLVLLGSMSLTVYLSKASMQVVFRIMRVAAVPSKPTPLSGLPITSSASRHPGVAAEQERV
jgi:hypothetical protein